MFNVCSSIALHLTLQASVSLTLAIPRSHYESESSSDNQTKVFLKQMLSLNPLRIREQFRQRENTLMATNLGLNPLRIRDEEGQSKGLGDLYPDARENL